MKPLSIKKNPIKEAVAKSQISLKINEDYNIDNINNINDLTQLTQIIDDNIKNLLEQKNLIMKKIETISNVNKDLNSNLNLIVDIYGKGKFDVVCEEFVIGDNLRRFVFLKSNVDTIESSFDSKYKMFSLKMSYLNASLSYTIKYCVDNINNETNSVICEYEIST